MKPWWHGWRLPKRGQWALEVTQFRSLVPDAPRWSVRAGWELLTGVGIVGLVSLAFHLASWLPFVIPIFGITTLASPSGAAVGPGYAGALQAPAIGAFNVRAGPFGATGDGVTDDTAAVHLARDAAGTGGKLYFPKGTYLTTTGLIANQANQVWLLDAGTTLTVPSGMANDTAVVWVQANGVGVQGFAGRNGIIDGNSANVNRVDGIRISVLGGQDPLTQTIADVSVQFLTVQNCPQAGTNCFLGIRIRIEDCRFQDTLSYATRFRRSCTDCWVRGCVAQKTVRGSNATAYQTDGLSDVSGTTTCSRIHIIDCFAKTWANAGVYMNGTLDSIIGNCHAEDCGDIGIDAEFTQKCTIIGCTAYNNVNEGIAAFQSVSWVTITGCTSRVTTSATNGHGIYVSGDHCTVTGNICQNNQGHGIYGISCTQCAFTGNVVSGPGATQNAGGCALQLLTGIECTISGNAVDNCYAHGIYLNGTTTTTVAGNMARNNGNGQAASAGIQVAGNSTDNVIIGNVATDDRGGGGHQGYGIFFAAAGDTRNFVAYNDCTGSGLQLGNIIDNGTANVRKNNRYTANAIRGVAVLVAGTVTVTTGEIRTGDTIEISRTVTGGTPGHLSVGAIVNATSFPINSSSGTDTSTVAWEIQH